MKVIFVGAVLSSIFFGSVAASAQQTSTCNFRYGGYKTVNNTQIARMSGSYKPGMPCRHTIELGASRSGGHVVILGAWLRKKPKNGRVTVSRNRLIYTPKGNGPDEFLVEYKFKNQFNTGYRSFRFKLKAR